jgi:hypothetical protein
MKVIYADLIAPYVPTPQAKPDWNEVEANVKAYGAPGEEMYLRAKTIHLYNQQDWVGFVPTAKMYLEKFGANIAEQDKAAFQKAIDDHK